MYIHLILCICTSHEFQFDRASTHVYKPSIIVAGLMSDERSRWVRVTGAAAAQYYDNDFHHLADEARESLRANIHPVK